MAKKVKKKKKVQNKEIVKEIKHLEALLQFSMRASRSESESLGQIFLDQANKISLQIEKLKQNQ